MGLQLPPPVNDEEGTPEPLSKGIQIDDDNDVVTVYGIRISGELFRKLTEITPPGVWIRVTKLENGTATIEQRREEDINFTR